jgi:8-oxo-dGTP pyrophosphatase MutT (NUDIX family)
VIRRRAARALLLDPAGRVLLLSAGDPADPGKGEWWELPGGGVGRDEQPGETALRELREEAGVVGARLGPCVYRHHAVFTFAGWHFDQDEEVYLAWLDDPASPRLEPELESIEALAFTGSRWWSVEDVHEAALAGATFYPSRLPQLLTRLRDTPEPAGLLLPDD